MKKVLTLIFVCLFIQAIWSSNVYILDKEEPSFHFHDPETGNYVQGEYSIQNHLNGLNISYDHGENLPNDLSPYDAVFALCGSWCVG